MKFLNIATASLLGLSSIFFFKTPIKANNIYSAFDSDVGIELPTCNKQFEYYKSKFESVSGGDYISEIKNNKVNCVASTINTNETFKEFFSNYVTNIKRGDGVTIKEVNCYEKSCVLYWNHNFDGYPGEAITVYIKTRNRNKYVGLYVSSDSLTKTQKLSLEQYHFVLGQIYKKK